MKFIRGLKLNINIISVGKVKEKSLLERINYYSKIIPCKLNLIELKDSNKLDEGKKIIEKLDKIKGIVFILSEEGLELTSKEFAKEIKLILEDITFVIGGPTGLSEDVKSKGKLISLSKMTFTHEMCKLFLLEQIYRAFSINQGKNYHKD
jgi:23S rRNA (pseudouridine1915-N3)-methyltransferase